MNAKDILFPQTLNIEQCIKHWKSLKKRLVSSPYFQGEPLVQLLQMLFEKLGDLAPVVGSADTCPTKQSYEVYDKLAGQADVQMAALESLCDAELEQLNEQLTELDVGIVGA